MRLTWPFFASASRRGLNEAVLARLQVPARAIRLLAGDVHNTTDELSLVAAALRSDGGR
jgi:hypothetical protein